MRISRPRFRRVPFRGVLLLTAGAFFVAGSPAHAAFTRILDAGPAVTDSLRSFGGSWADWNGDGHLDIYVVGEELRLYPADGSGNFGNTGGAAVSNPGGHWHSMGMWADWNDDGWLDLYLGNFGTLLPDLSFVSPGRDRLFRNAGPPSFEMIEVPLETDSTATVATTWVDYDRDGDLDLSVSSGQSTPDLFYRNDGGTFARLTGLPFLNALSVGAVSMWVDYDEDGDEDFYVVNHGAPNELYRSLLMETANADSFETVTTGPLVTDGVEFDITAEWADYDNDGDLDAFVPVTNGGIDKLFRNEGNGSFSSVSAAMTVTGSASFGAWGDFDNDGDEDLFVGRIAFSNAAPRLYRNEGAGTFVQITTGLGSLLDVLPRVQAGQWADYDNDGDLDLYAITFTATSNPTSAPRPNYLHRNDDDGGNHWIQIRCTGTVSNRSAIGAKVRVVASIGGSSVRQYRPVWGSMAGNSEQKDLRVHFGLGDAATVDSLIVEWPSGIVQTLTNVDADQLVSVVEPSATSAPDPDARRLGLVSFPNPFRSSTTLAWDTLRPGPVSIGVYDVRGRAIRTLVSPESSSGRSSVVWNGRNDQGQTVPTGIYCYRLAGPGGVRTGTVLRVR